MQYKTRFLFTLTIFFAIFTACQGEILFKDNFEDDAIDKPPKKWMVGFKGKDDAKVIWDPERAKNKVFSSPTERHDVNGAIYITGKGKDWTDYYVQWEMLFPKEFYMDIVFRYTEGEAFYLLDKIQKSWIFGSVKGLAKFRQFGSFGLRNRKMVVVSTQGVW